MKAIWGETVIAQSIKTIVVEDNHYFPPESIKMNFLNDSEFKSVCPLKGSASYYDVKVGNKELKRAAWYYPSPKEKFNQIKGYVAFWKDVKVID